MFFLTYMLAELRRRRSRTILTALGLGVGVALVVAVSALSTGLADAQQRVLKPLTGVGTDMSVTRPLRLTTNSGVFSQLSPVQRARLRSQARQGAGFGFSGARPGSKIDTDVANSSQVSFATSRVDRLAALQGVSETAGYLTLNVNHVSGTVPKVRTVTGIDRSKPGLAPVTPDQIVHGRYFSSAGGAYQAVVAQSYANSKNIRVGQRISLFSKPFTVVGIARAPLGSTASDVYVELSTLQRLSGYTNQVNGVNVRADDGAAVPAVAREIKAAFSGASVTTAADLARRVGGSLSDARSLSARLGRALEAVALAAAVLIACLLTLASVSRRVREIGTLKAIGWSQWAVVRQISGEALLSGVLGGVVGALVGALAVWAINASDWTLKASVAAASGSAAGPAGPGSFGFGAARAASGGPGSELVHITTSVDLQLLLTAVALAALGGLAAGAVGGARAARMRPAAALRNIE